MKQVVLIFLILPFIVCEPSKLAPTPPMGWMSWEVFRCNIDCKANPDNCVNEQLYKQMADHLAADGYLEAGYKTVSIDDCWAELDRENGQMVPNKERFPNGMKSLGDYMHSKNVEFGIYSDEGTKTCGGYPGSKGFEEADAKQFAGWGVDYLKLDGCYNNQQGFVTGYPAMGDALQNSGRDIVYSCSWPAYLGNDESKKPFDAMINAGCNLWRNWADIQDNWGSLEGIIDHWGDYSQVLQQAGGPHHWNDMDMLLIGNKGKLSVIESQTQMAIWSIMASPLIMGNDLRSIDQEFKDILLNREVIAVNQDPKGQPGLRISPKGDSEVWARNLSDGSVAVALYNKRVANCTWEVTQGSYKEGGAQGNIECVTGSLNDIRSKCCKNPDCVSFSFQNNVKDGSAFACLRKSDDEGITVNPIYDGWSKNGGNSVNIKVELDTIGFSQGTKVNIRDLFEKKDVGQFENLFQAEVKSHGVKFFKITTVKEEFTEKGFIQM